jgi:hypothetical protein
VSEETEFATAATEASGGQKNLEASLVNVENGSLNLIRVQDLMSDIFFDALVAQLRDETSDISIEKRTQYELHFFSLEKSRDDTVASDTMECGNYLCAVELRADNRSALNAYIEDAIQSDAFEAHAILYLPGSKIYSSGDSRRILFPPQSER